MNIDQLQETFFLFLVASTRISAAFVIIPFLNKQALGGSMIRNGIVASMSIFTYPMVAYGFHEISLTTVETVLILGKEVFIGVMIGFVIAIPFWSIESVGFFIDNQRGATMASSLNPLSGSQTSPLGILLTQALVTVFFVSGSFLLFMYALYSSYALWPVFQYFPSLSGNASTFFLGQLDTIIRFAVLLGGPVVIAMFLAEFGLALISRFAPQLNVFILSMPIKSAVAIAILMVYLPIVIHFFSDYLKGMDNIIGPVIDLLS
jgi:type III secretion protein T